MCSQDVLHYTIAVVYDEAILPLVNDAVLSSVEDFIDAIHEVLTDEVLSEVLNDEEPDDDAQRGGSQ